MCSTTQAFHGTRLTVNLYKGSAGHHRVSADSLCAHEAQYARDSVADLAHAVPPAAREPTFRHIALPMAESQRLSP